MRIEFLKSGDKETMEKIALWYFNEWQIPMDKTIDRLEKLPVSITMFQLILFESGKIVATAGLCKEVSVHQEHPQLKKYDPWVSLLYTDLPYRGKGLASALLVELEVRSKELGFSKIYLSTHTNALQFYQKRDWKVMESCQYKDKLTYIMYKNL
ncbi:MAG: GNAT family N-acetyltransferase [Bacteroidota bacterium]